MTNEQPFPETFEQQQHIPEPYLTAIGQVVINWCMLESVMDLAIAKLAAFDLHDPRGVVVTVHMTWPQKTDVLEALVDLLKTDHPRLPGKHAAAKPFLTKAHKGRNRVVHGQWGNHPQKGVVKIRSSARGKLKFDIEPISLDELAAISLDIGNAGLAVVKMIISQ